MPNKFGSVPVEEDTRILFQSEMKLGVYEVLYQKWFWEGITAESLIFCSSDIAPMSDSECHNLVRTSPLIQEDSSLTLKHSESGFTFVNFNCVSE